MQTAIPDYRDITYELIGSVARISHNRPAFRNAENRNLLSELDDAVSRANADENVRVLVLAGTGDHFSAGHDLKEGALAPDLLTTEGRWEFEEKFYLGYCMRIFDSTKPTIAQVQGGCIAGGFMVANMCDLMVAADDAFFSDPVVHTLSAAAVEVLIHPWVLGMRLAKDFLFTGRRIEAAEAHAIGMVNRLVPRAELESATLELAQRVAAAPPFALRVLKRSLNRSWEMQGLRNAINAHFDSHQVTHASEEFAQVRARGFTNAIQKGAATAN